MSIEEIVKELTELAELYDTRDKEGDGNICMKAIEAIRQLKSRAEKAEAERDGAIKDMRPKDNCDICKHSREGIEDCVKYDLDCAKCNSDKCVCRNCRDENKWEWRGAQGGKK